MRNVFVAAGLACCALGAQAGVSIVAGNPDSSTFLTLSGANTDPTSAPDLRTIPFGTVGNFIAAGGGGEQTNAVDLDVGSTSYVSFLWGSPDTWNTLLVVTDADTYTFNQFSGFSFGFTGFGANNSLDAFYVGFKADDGEMITDLVFYGGGFPEGDAINAFEASNFSVTPVPEPETYALMLAGLGVVGFMARRRRAA